MTAGSGADDARPSAGRRRRAGRDDEELLSPPEHAEVTAHFQHMLDSVTQRLSDAREKEAQLRLREQRVQALEERARQLYAEVHMMEARVSRAAAAAALETAPRSPVTATTPRAERAAAAREHELARMKAKLINGETAGAELAERIRFAYQQNGKLSLETLGGLVGYSKATLSKVFNGKMAPAWALVRKLGTELKVPQALVMQEWLPLWIAADTYRHRKPSASRATAPIPVETIPAAGPAAAVALTGPTGHTCPKCGGWVVDAAQHANWHTVTESGASQPPGDPIGKSWVAWTGVSEQPAPGLLGAEPGHGPHPAHERPLAQEVLSEVLRRTRNTSPVPGPIAELAEQMGVPI
ncbi:helix-turn-helix domain-containing protein [Actinoplanes teichomyceticus]|uniref:HTH cro/C1-type domain-containing protein n=1 Tax=Actinoplanes teichomyceticus TaxID=1867 RepID=A0A561WIG2_ACTTI|nr:helix-turn-helix transcriptional regulator [Actinoplanes teichomyceticus]TWG23669.1 hypothetical protein FHX34_102219 [Actinoplanes teichomyceticus]GIF11710.1 hypothetical protein Ate01nite_17420 [Actinoplanes teichomyceticus]